MLSNRGKLRLQCSVLFSAMGWRCIVSSARVHRPNTSAMNCWIDGNKCFASVNIVPYTLERRYCSVTHIFIMRIMISGHVKVMLSVWSATRSLRVDPTANRSASLSSQRHCANKQYGQCINLITTHMMVHMIVTITLLRENKNWKKAVRKKWKILTDNGMQAAAAESARQQQSKGQTTRRHTLLYWKPRCTSMSESNNKNYKNNASMQSEKIRPTRCNKRVNFMKCM